MNRITNKEYLIDITIKSLETQQPNHPTKVKCEVHYSDDSYLRIQLQPMLRNGIAFFCDQRLRIPFSSEVSIVFKFIKPNKKQSFLGHYLLEVQKWLSDKRYSIKAKDKLEECQAYVDFECRIIDKQLLCESDTQQPQLEANPYAIDKSIVTWAQQKHKIKVNRPLSELNTPIIFQRPVLAPSPLPPQQYGKLVREAEDILKKKQLFSQKHAVLGHFSRDRYGRLRTDKIKELEQRLNQSRKEKTTYNLIIYSLFAVFAFLLGMQI